MNCGTCTYRYHDGFCMQNLYYVNTEDTCKLWSDTPVEFKKERIYKLCCDFKKLYEQEQERERLREKYPDDLALQLNTDFPFITWCLNDLHREMSLWKTKR